jgi:hypothetical protein
LARTLAPGPGQGAGIDREGAVSGHVEEVKETVGGAYEEPRETVNEVGGTTSEGGGEYLRETLAGALAGGLDRRDHA